MPNFDSALLKTQRAGSQADELHKQFIDVYGDADDPPGRVEFERDADPRKWRGIFRLLKKPSDDWPVLLGEIIHNLRSALDHLVYEASAPDEDGAPLEGTEYSIYIDEDKFRERGLFKIRGLNDATKAFIEKYQPFSRDEALPAEVAEPDFISYLWLLHQLSNTDKHRLLNLLVVPHILGNFRVTYSGSDEGLTGKHVISRASITKSGVLEDGAEYFSFWTPEPLPADVKVSMNTEITIDIQFGDATPVAKGLSVFDALRGMGKWVGGTRNEFIKMNPDPS